jgi:hypothetical protein
MAGGRPTKYTPELIERAKEYANGQYEIIGDVIPTIAGLANYLDIVRDTVHEWVKEEDKKEFSDIVAKMLQSQESILVAKGLDGKFNASITKLLLTKHGYSDKVEQEIKSEAKHEHTIRELPSTDDWIKGIIGTGAETPPAESSAD